MENTIHDFMNEVAAKNVGETEFLQAVEEVAEVIIPFMEENSKYNNKEVTLNFATNSQKYLHHIAKFSLYSI